MTTEQREAIDRLNKDKNKPLACGDITIVNISDLDTALSLIKEQQEKMENKDKQIDLMAELVYKRFKAELLLEYGFENEEQLKQYFERKSKK